MNKLSVLMLVQENQAQDRSFLYKCLDIYIDLDLYFLSKLEQSDLKNFFDVNIDTFKYDRIILDLRFKKELREWGRVSSRDDSDFHEFLEKIEDRIGETI